MFIVLQGPNTWFPLAWLSKIQSSTARSTTEAEFISAARAFYDHVIPLLDIFDTIFRGHVAKVPTDFKGQMEVLIMEDNQVTRKIMMKGWSPKLQHVGRVHKVNIGCFSEMILLPWFDVEYCPSDEQCGLSLIHI